MHQPASALTGVYLRDVIQTDLKKKEEGGSAGSSSARLGWNNCVYVCWISDRVTQWQSMQVSTGLPSLSLSPSLPDVMVGIAAAGSPQQHESYFKKRLRGARVITRWLLLLLLDDSLITHLPPHSWSVNQAVYQLLDNTSLWHAWLHWIHKTKRQPSF